MTEILATAEIFPMAGILPMTEISPMTKTFPDGNLVASEDRNILSRRAR
jgi:hypothetical protein